MTNPFPIFDPVKSFHFFSYKFKNTSDFHTCSSKIKHDKNIPSIILISEYPQQTECPLTSFRKNKATRTTQIKSDRQRCNLAPLLLHSRLKQIRRNRQFPASSQHAQYGRLCDSRFKFKAGLNTIQSRHITENVRVYVYNQYLPAAAILYARKQIMMCVCSNKNEAREIGRSDP